MYRKGEIPILVCAPPTLSLLINAVSDCHTLTNYPDHEYFEDEMNKIIFVNISDKVESKEIEEKGKFYCYNIPKNYPPLNILNDILMLTGE